MGDLNYQDVQPIGTRRGRVHRNYGYTEYGNPDPRTGMYEEDLPVYPDTHREGGRQIRDERVRLGLTLGEAALAANLTVVQLSKLERGHATCDHRELFLRWGPAYRRKDPLPEARVLTERERAMGERCGLEWDSTSAPPTAIQLGCWTDPTNGAARIWYTNEGWLVFERGSFSSMEIALAKYSEPRLLRDRDIDPIADAVNILETFARDAKEGGKLIGAQPCEHGITVNGVCIYCGERPPVTIWVVEGRDAQGNLHLLCATEDSFGAHDLALQEVNGKRWESVWVTDWTNKVEGESAKITDGEQP